MQALFYLTPILYPLALVKNISLQKLLMLNPMAQAIQDARNLLVTKETITIAEVYSTPLARLAVLGIGLLTLAIGVVYFKRESKYFAENL